MSVSDMEGGGGVLSSRARLIGWAEGGGVTRETNWMAEPDRAPSSQSPQMAEQALAIYSSRKTSNCDRLPIGPLGRQVERVIGVSHVSPDRKTGPPRHVIAANMDTPPLSIGGGGLGADHSRVLLGRNDSGRPVYGRAMHGGVGGGAARDVEDKGGEV